MQLAEFKNEALSDFKGNREFFRAIDPQLAPARSGGSKNTTQSHNSVLAGAREGQLGAAGTSRAHNRKGKGPLGD